MSAEVVVDASLALKWALAEIYTAEAEALLDEWEQAGTRRIVPSWFACEIANVLYQRVRKGDLTVGDAQLAVRGLLDEVIARDVEPRSAERALELAHLLAQPATYDTQYLALAEVLGVELWTADERFWQAAHTTCPWIHWIGERLTATP